MWYQKNIAPSASTVTPNGTNNATNSASKNGNWKTIVSNDKIIVKTRYEGRKLIYSGTVPLPSPCHKIDHTLGFITAEMGADVSPSEGTLQIKILEPEGEQMCAQVITNKSFSGEVIIGSPFEKIIVFLDGEKVE